MWKKGHPVLQSNGTYEEKQTKLKIIFENVDIFTENNPYEINYIDYINIDFYRKDEKNLVCFSLNDEDPDSKPYLYIACENIKYEEIDQK